MASSPSGACLAPRPLQPITEPGCERIANLQIPPDLVVKSQIIEIVEVI